MTTDYIEKIAGIEGQITQLKNRQRGLMQKFKTQERKARTKRLIERGAIVESFIDGADTITNDQFKSFIESVTKTDQARRVLEEVRKNGGDGTVAMGSKTNVLNARKPTQKITDSELPDGKTDGAGRGGGAGGTA